MTVDLYSVVRRLLPIRHLNTHTQHDTLGQRDLLLVEAQLLKLADDSECFIDVGAQWSDLVLSSLVVMCYS